MNGVFFADYVAAFAEAGARVGVVYPDLVGLRYFRRRRKIPFLPEILAENAAGQPVIRVRGLHTSFGLPGPHMFRFRSWLRQGLAAYRADHGEPDVLHAMCTIPAGWACTHLEDPLARRVIITEHTGPFSLALKPRGAAWYVRTALAKAAAVFAVSAHGRGEIRAIGITREIDVCPNPVAPQFTPTPPPPAAVDRSGRRIYHAVFLGRLTELKGVPELIEAAVIASGHDRVSIHWHIVGSGPLENKLLRRFASAGIADRLTMHGLCDRDTVAQLLRDAHLLVLPSHTENCPLAICEALSVGRPVVTSTATGCRALVTDGDGLSTPIMDPRALAAAVIQLAADYEQWDWQAISERARQRFSGLAIAARYAKVFRDAAAVVPQRPQKQKAR